MSCGAALESPDGAEPPASEPPAPARSVGAPAPAPDQEERRTVTVLFADLSGYTSVAERLDAETVKALVERCLGRFAAEVERFGGTVDKFIGDNVMAVFGAPVAHEDDPERAVRAAFAMQDAMVDLNRELEPEFGCELALRVGVNTGEVLAGRVGEAYTVLGDAVNVAARLQAAAPVGGILVGERTHRLTGAAVAYRELDPLALKGKAERVAAWEACELRRAGAAGVRAPATPLVGREEDLARLEGLFERVERDGAPHLVTVVGQAGVGKSRLLYELEHRLERRDRPARVRRGRCLAFGQGVVYWPLIEIVRAECGIGEGDDGQIVRAKLAERLVPALRERGEAGEAERRMAPLERLLGAQVQNGGEPAGHEDHQDAREGFFGAVRAVLEALAGEEPLVLAWEDIHWADEGTLDLIDYLSQWLRGPVLQVCLARDELLERRPAWSSVRRGATVAFLEPLTEDETTRLIEELLRSTGAMGERPRSLAERSGGNPLFAEAMVQRIAEDEGALPVELPDTVQGLLAARLDSLDPLERQLVSHAAVVGRTFWESALEPIAEAADADLQRVLASLREKDILLPGDAVGPEGERELAFKHVLVRDVAYEMLSKAVRARKHAEVGASIERRSRAGEGAVGLVAEHYARAAAFAAEAHLPAQELAELRTLALTSGEAAGDAAAALYSNGEALAHYRAAAALAGAEEETAQRIAEKSGDVALRLGRVDPAIEMWEGGLAYRTDRGELAHVAELHRKIGAALAHKGERKRAIEHHQQGINLIKDQEPSLTLVRLYEEAAWLYMQVGDNMLAIYASEKALRLAESLGEQRAASRAHGIFGRVFGRIGDAAKARENLERSVELARESGAGETVLALLALGHNLEHTEGDYGGAGERYREALELAERIGDVPAQIELQAALARLAYHRCDWEEARGASDASAELAEREGLVGKLCLPYVLRGRLRWREGDWDASAELLGTARELAERVGWSEVEFDALIALATTALDSGDPAAAEAALTDALAICERAGLAPQSIQADAALALTRALAGRMPAAAEAADRAAESSQRVHDPAGGAAALEARGLVAEMPAALEDLRAARAGWEQLGRPLETARCEMLIGRRLLEQGEDEGREVLSTAATLFERLGVAHLAVTARELAAADAGVRAPR
jgi:class 3 adenylate cyclase/tetratricopeptide (TPR) repeat protein